MQIDIVLPFVAVRAWAYFGSSKHRGGNSHFRFVQLPHYVPMLEDGDVFARHGTDRGHVNGWRSQRVRPHRLRRLVRAAVHGHRAEAPSSSSSAADRGNP